MSLHSYLGSTPILDGLNFIDRLDILMLTFTFIDLDLALAEHMALKFTDTSLATNKVN